MNKKAVLQAIPGSGAIISTVAKRLGCAWETADRWVRKWPETVQALKDESEAILDMAEGVIYSSIKEGNSQDAKWLLAMKAKNRGYVDKHEIEHSGNIEITALPPEEREKRIAELLIETTITRTNQDDTDTE